MSICEAYKYICMYAIMTKIVKWHLTKTVSCPTHNWTVEVGVLYSNCKLLWHRSPLLIRHTELVRDLCVCAFLKTWPVQSGLLLTFLWKQNVQSRSYQLVSRLKVLQCQHYYSTSAARLFCHKWSNRKKWWVVICRLVDSMSVRGRCTREGTNSDTVIAFGFLLWSSGFPLHNKRDALLEKNVFFLRNIAYYWLRYFLANSLINLMPNALFVVIVLLLQGTVKVV